MNKYYKVVLGHAVCDEHGHGVNGEAGDQTGKEVRYQFWYNRSKGWHTVMRAKKLKVRKKIAETACKIVENHLWGYDMNQRYTGYNAILNYNFDPDNTVVPVECDCSTMATIECASAGIMLPKETRTATMRTAYKNSGAFYLYTAKKYTNKPDNLKVGDIIVGEGHTATVVNTIYWLEKTLTRENANATRTADVQALQARLSELGYILDVDGSFGPRTEDIVKIFQHSAGLMPDGVVGRKTAVALGMVYGY